MILPPGRALLEKVNTSISSSVSSLRSIIRDAGKDFENNAATTKDPLAGNPGQFDPLPQIPSDFPFFPKLDNANTVGNSAEHITVPTVMVEETIVYCMLFILLLFLMVHLVRCVRTTLDPYNTVARAAWFETLNKAKVESFP